MATKIASEDTLVAALRCSSSGCPSCVSTRTANNIRCFRRGTVFIWPGFHPVLSMGCGLPCPPTIHHTPGPREAGGRPRGSRISPLWIFRESAEYSDCHEAPRFDSPLGGPSRRGGARCVLSHSRAGPVRSHHTEPDHGRCPASLRSGRRDNLGHGSRW